MLAECWTVEATRRSELLREGEREATTRWARQALTRADVAVRHCIDSCDETARQDLVAAAAEALEACAATWHAFGPVAGPRQLHLVRRLERHLAEHERLVLAAEAGCRLDRQAVATPGRAARLAIERLDDGTLDPATALLALEEGVVAFAAIAIRAVENIDASGCANGRPGRALAPAPAALQDRLSEVQAHAQTLLEPRCRSDLATWLSECLIIASPSTALSSATRTLADTPADQADLDAYLRRRWLRLGARELLVARELSQRPSDPPGPDPSEIVGTAAHILADTGLATRAGEFDPRLAWANQAGALSALIPVCARALRGDNEAGQRARRVVIDRLARVVLVLWLVDHKSERPRAGTGS